MADPISNRLSAAGERWLLPAGIEETLPPEAEALEQLRRDLLDLFSSWGYKLVVPPFIEYLESLLTGIHDPVSREVRSRRGEWRLVASFREGSQDGALAPTVT